MESKGDGSAKVLVWLCGLMHILLIGWLTGQKATVYIDGGLQPEGVRALPSWSEPSLVPPPPSTLITSQWTTHKQRPREGQGGSSEFTLVTQPQVR